jgi:hypothetical protein
MNSIDLSSVPGWLGTGIFSAGIAALAFVLRSFIDWIAQIRERHRQRRSSLVQLRSLLRVAKVGFQTQNKQVRELCKRVIARDANAPSQEEGYESFLSRAYRLMDADEKNLHSIVRGYTDHVLKPANAALLKWINDDSYFKSQTGDGSAGKLARSLAALEIHLLMWHAKYEVWIPTNPTHALVYLDDESEHGIGFPHGIDEQVDATLAEMK